MQTQLTEEMRQHARALVFTADFVPQPAQPISFWAMNWTGRAGASI